LFDLNSTYSISIEIHPRMAWIYPIAKICQRWGVWLAGPLAPWMAPSSPHGRVYGVSCKPTPPHHPRNACFCRCCCLGLKPLQVQGCKPCNKPYLPIALAIASTSSSPVTGLRRKPPMPAASTCC
ncbi:hypothetical protein C7E17_22650, partial [Stenotrophomonas maltophilia]